MKKATTKAEMLEAGKRKITLGISTTINQLSLDCFDNSKRHGFWGRNAETRNDGEMIALIHYELSEMLEAIRKPMMSDHIPTFTLVEEEAADVLIRLLDMSAGREWDIGGALVAKMEFNKSRSFKHGKEF